MGHPITHSFLRELADEIRKPRVNAENSRVIAPLGTDWSKRFMRRNPQLKTAMASGIEIQRKEVTKEMLDTWFGEFKRIVEEYGIDSENIYNMDETGSLPDVQQVLHWLTFIQDFLLEHEDLGTSSFHPVKSKSITLSPDVRSGLR